MLYGGLLANSDVIQNLCCITTVTTVEQCKKLPGLQAAPFGDYDDSNLS